MRQNKIQQFCIGIDIGGTKIKAGIASLQGGIIDFIEMSTHADSASPEPIVDIITGLIQNLIIKNSSIKIDGIGIGIPGIVSEDGRATVFANIRAFNNYPLAENIQAKFGIPVFIDNDANNAACGEHLFGVAREKNNFVMITFGTGIGGGIYINGDIYRGSNGCAGEIGHMIIVPDGRPCPCGKSGCWERYGSATAIVSRAKELLIDSSTSSLFGYSDNLSAKIIENEALNGDQLSIMLYDEAAHYIGIGIANIINCLNPELIIIGGGLSYAGDFLLDRIKDTAKKYTLGIAWDAVTLSAASLGNRAGVLGSAARAFSSIKITRDSL